MGRGKAGGEVKPRMRGMGGREGGKEGEEQGGYRIGGSERPKIRETDKGRQDFYERVCSIASGGLTSQDVNQR